MKIAQLAADYIVDIANQIADPRFAASDDVAGMIEVDITGIDDTEALDSFVEEICAKIEETDSSVLADEAAKRFVHNIAEYARGYVNVTPTESKEDEATYSSVISHSLPTGDASISISATQDSDATNKSEVENGTTENKTPSAKRKRS